jgi:hypothetical protein
VAINPLNIWTIEGLKEQVPMFLQTCGNFEWACLFVSINWKVNNNFTVFSTRRMMQTQFRVRTKAIDLLCQALDWGGVGVACSTLIGPSQIGLPKPSLVLKSKHAESL